ncbi:MAG: SMI1/KNR4 family protein [Rhodococcus sp. (in: high G+C Gram-positive bacteria)]
METRRAIDLRVPLLFVQTLEGGAGIQNGDLSSDSCGRLIFLGTDFVVVYTGATYGPAEIGISVQTTPPAATMTGWETIEEGTFAVTGPLSLIPHPAGTETSIEDIAGLTRVDDVSLGLWHIRVHARGRDADRGDVAVLLQLWPTEHPLPLTTVKIGDSYVPQMLTTVPTQPAPPPATDTAGAVHGSTVHREGSADAVTEQWTRIAHWLRTNLTSSPIAGADRAQITRAVDTTGVEWPDELTAFFEQVNGFPHENWVALMPAHELFDLDRLVEERQMELDIWGELDEEMGGAPVRGNSAGTTAFTYLPEFLPFAGLDGNLLFIDTRPGDLYGCITEFDNVDTDTAGPRWASLTAMLSDLADSLETGAAFGGGWKRAVTDGNLNWQYLP